jgi:hypothetical protein
VFIDRRDGTRDFLFYDGNFGSGLGSLGLSSAGGCAACEEKQHQCWQQAYWHINSRKRCLDSHYRF